jgi:hypothetical protein
MKNTVTDRTTNALSCSLPVPELRLRKETVIRSLAGQIAERKELKNGYSFKFNFGESIIDELAEFIKTERACCRFFSFHLSFRSNQTGVWLKITGPPGVKEFIRGELGM